MCDNRPFVSIIMPVYNCEKFLSESIESAISQSYKNWELIIVDDGSKDRSISIIESYAKKDKRIRFYKNESGEHGLGPARNVGLSYAAGEYLYFLDADDWMEDCLLQCAVHRMRETNADIVQFGVLYEGNDGVQQYCWRGKDILTKEEIKKEFPKFWKESRKSLWIHFFRREVVKTIRFENRIIGEDLCYIIDALSSAEKIAYIAKALYHYRYVKGSTSHCWIENTIECREMIWNHQRNFLDSFQGDMDQLAYAQVAYGNYIWALYQLSSRLCPLSYRERRRELAHLKETMEFDSYRGIYPLKQLRGLDKVKYTLVKYHLEGILLLLGPLFLRIFRGE